MLSTAAFRPSSFARGGGGYFVLLRFTLFYCDSDGFGFVWQNWIRGWKVPTGGVGGGRRARQDDRGRIMTDRAGCPALSGGTCRVDDIGVVHAGTMADGPGNVPLPGNTFLDKRRTPFWSMAPGYSMDG